MALPTCIKLKYPIFKGFAPAIDTLVSFGLAGQGVSDKEDDPQGWLRDLHGHAALHRSYRSVLTQINELISFTPDPPWTLPPR